VCQVCGAGTTCAGQQCVGVTGPGVAIGGPCTSATDCTPGAFCLPEQSFTGPTGFPGGA
jgi:hypothetical protein